MIYFITLTTTISPVMATTLEPEESTEESTEESLEVESTEETSLEVEPLEVESTEESTLDVKPTEESLEIEATEEMSLEVEGMEKETTTPPATKEKPTEVGNKAKEAKKNRVTNGKEGNIILRVSAGTGKLPVGGEFYGRIFKNKSLENEEIYMWQTMTHQWSTPVGELYAGFGIKPNIDVGFFTGVGVGKFWVDYHSISETNYSKALGAQDYANTSKFSGFEALYVPKAYTNKNFRPLAGVGMTYYQGKAADDFLEDFPPDGIPPLEPMNAMTLDLTLGGEVSASKSMDLYVHIPLALTVWSSPVPTYVKGSGRIEQNELVDPSVSELGLIGGGVMLGMQFRVPVINSVK